MTNHEFALRTKSETIQSVLDTGATRHFTGIKSDINQLKRWSKPEIVYVANGGTTKAIGYGTMELPISHGTLLLYNVWYIPEFKGTRLISIWELNKAGISVNFDDRIATRTTKSTGKVVFKSYRHEGLYTLESTTQNRAFQAALESRDQDQDQGAKDNDVRGGSESEDWQLLHRRLGHIAYKRIKQLLDGNSYGLPKPKGKRQLPKGEQLYKREGRKIRRLYADLSGIHSTSIRGYRYYLVISCDASRIVWVKLLKSKYI